MTKNVLITGAGVDKASGIDFPLANRLLPEIAQFIQGEGSEFDKTLRAAIPNLRFDFSKYINSAINSLTNISDTEIRRIVETIQRAVEKIENDNDKAKKQGQVIVRLFNKLAEIQASSKIDDETHNLIKEAFGNEFNESDFIVDVHKMSLSDTFKAILKSTLHQSLSENSNPIADAMASDLLDIEQLLIQKFLGFYNHKTPEVKNYIYIAWSLWGYLVHRQRKVLKDFVGSKLPFYSSLPNDISAITLNYTTFLESCNLKDTVYFHGGLNEYVRMDTRQLLAIENIQTLDLCEFIRSEIAPNINLLSDNFEDNRHVIPSLIPPLRLKPILSQKYIETWHKANKLIHEADKVVVVGYSFNSADEHFNDIVRNGGNKKYYIVAPDATSNAYMKRIEKVFNVSLDSFTNTNIQGKTSKTTTNIRLISAKAEEINVSGLLGITPN
jgi:ribosomal protein L23